MSLQIVGYCLMPGEEFFSHAMARMRYVYWDFDQVCLVLVREIKYFNDIARGEGP
jgi:hypothetical protein